mgnify:CR=1 FL=1
MKTLAERLEELPKETHSKAREVIEQAVRGMERATRGLAPELKKEIYLLASFAIQATAASD